MFALVDDVLHRCAPSELEHAQVRRIHDCFDLEIPVAHARVATDLVQRFRIPPVTL